MMRTPTVEILVSIYETLRIRYDEANSILTVKDDYCTMSYTIKQIIAALPSSSQPLEHTVDQLLYGDENREVRKVAVVFAANQEVLQQAAALDIELIITHEGLYYSHHQSHPAVDSSEIFWKREQFIKQHQLAIYRYHDHCHRHTPDLLTYGLIKQLNWDTSIIAEEAEATIVELPLVSLEKLIDHLKQRLNLPYLRYAGSKDMHCAKIAVLVGFRGNGATVLPLIAKHKLDAVIIGEGMEWEVPEFVRDAALLGSPCALITLGHAESEQPGMQHIAQLLQAACPELEVHHLTANPIYMIG